MTNQCNFKEMPLVLVLKAKMYGNYRDNVPGQTVLEVCIHVVIGRILEANYKELLLCETRNNNNGLFLLRMLLSKTC